jgi:hypothetical protein
MEKRLRYYTNNNKYMGWIIFDLNKHYYEYLSWIRSGNYFMLDDIKIDTIKQFKKYKG